MLLDIDSLAPRRDDVLGRVFAPGIVARANARIRARTLDRALAGGAHPSDSPALAHRAARLASPQTRRHAADGLERLLAAATGPPSRRRVHPRRGAVVAQAEQLRDTAALLRAPIAVYAQGMAMLTLLLSDGTGPAYSEGRDGAFAGELERAREALTGRIQTRRT